MVLFYFSLEFKNLIWTLYFSYWYVIDCDRAVAAEKEKAGIIETGFNRVIVWFLISYGSWSKGNIFWILKPNVKQYSSFFFIIDNWMIVFICAKITILNSKTFFVSDINNIIKIDYHTEFSRSYVVKYLFRSYFIILSFIFVEYNLGSGAQLTHFYIFCISFILRK